MGETAGLGATEFAGAALVIEDDALVALERSDLLSQMGFGPIALAAAISAALRKRGFTP